MSKSDDPAGQAFRLFLPAFYVAADDQSPVRGKKPGEAPEGMAYVIQVLEKVQMIFLHIQDQTYFREET